MHYLDLRLKQDNVLFQEQQCVFQRNDMYWVDVSVFKIIFFNTF